jgi:hypothetical protein
MKRKVKQSNHPADVAWRNVLKLGLVGRQVFLMRLARECCVLAPLEDGREQSPQAVADYLAANIHALGRELENPRRGG